MKKICFLILLLLITACIRKTQYSGYSFDEANVEDIEVGITTKNTLLKELGSPSLRTKLSANDKEVWIYYSDVKCGYFFLRPKVKERKTLAVTFDQNNVVTSKEQCGIEKDKSTDVQIVSDFTRKKENKNNFFIDIVNNIGTVRSM